MQPRSLLAKLADMKVPATIISVSHWIQVAAHEPLLHFMTVMNVMVRFEDSSIAEKLKRRMGLLFWDPQRLGYNPNDAWMDRWPTGPDTLVPFPPEHPAPVHICDDFGYSEDDARCVNGWRRRRALEP